MPGRIERLSGGGIHERARSSEPQAGRSQSLVDPAAWDARAKRQLEQPESPRRREAKAGGTKAN